MPNKPSKRLFAYLEAMGALNGTPEQLHAAKLEYRRLYKQTWKKTAKKNREIRTTFDETEYAFIKQKAELRGMAPTTYLRELAISPNGVLIPYRDTLLLVLQKIGMANIQSFNENKSYALLIEEAEQLLMEYLKSN